MDIVGRIAGLLGRSKRAVPDWQILIEIDGVARDVTMPGPLCVAWARSPIGADDFERAVAEIHRRIAIIRTVSRSTFPQLAKLTAA